MVTLDSGLFLDHSVYARIDDVTFRRWCAPAFEKYVFYVFCRFQETWLFTFSELFHTFSRTPVGAVAVSVLHWRTGRTAETSDWKRRWCERTRFRTVDPSARCRHLRTCQTMQISLPTVSSLYTTAYLYWVILYGNRCAKSYSWQTACDRTREVE